MDSATREFVRRRAGDRCEYCGIPQELTPFISFHVEHIVAKQHLDIIHDSPDGLAYACDRCNAFKGPNLSSIDPDSGVRVDLFDRRAHDWDTHFEHEEGWIIGKTPTGRATVRLLNMNELRRVELRLQWLAERGEY